MNASEGKWGNNLHKTKFNATKIQNGAKFPSLLTAWTVATGGWLEIMLQYY